MSNSLRLLLLLSSAVLYALAFPPIGLRPLVFLGVAGLIWSVRDCKPREAFYWGLLWGLVAIATALSWIWGIFHALSILLWLIHALFPALFAAVTTWAARRGLAGWHLACFIALAWTGIEFVRCELMWLRFPWMSVGLALEPWPLVSWIGVYGLGMVVVAIIASALYARWWMPLAILLTGLLFWFLEPSSPKRRLEAAATSVAVAVVQAESAPLRDYLAYSEKAPPGTQLIVWPEYAVPAENSKFENSNFEFPSSDLAKIHELAAKKGVIIVFGTQTGLGGNKWQNTALTVDGSRVLGEHGKVHTVHLFDDGEQGPSAKAIETPLGKMGTPICFDCDFQDVVRGMTRDGATFFAVPSMDAADWGEKQHIQHAQLFRLRAAENRRSFAVAASSGVSQIIGPTGRVSAHLPAMQEGVLDGRISPNTRLTFFTRWGWLTPWLALAGMGLWTVRLLRTQAR